MKPKEQKPDEVYRIIDRNTGAVQSSYSRAYCDESDFRSVSEARNANVHGIYADKAKFAIAKYRVIYELIEEDSDPPTPEEVETAQREATWREEIEARLGPLSEPVGADPLEARLQGLVEALKRSHHIASEMTYRRLAHDLKR